MTGTDAPDADLPRGIALAWGVAADPQRGPKREMSVERIVDAAVELADAEGIAAVSMAAVAARLGYTPMSLYRYVSAKDDLLLLMQEEATGVPPEEAASGSWRERLEVIYRAQVELYLRHPWVVEIPILGSPTTPNGASWMEAGLAALEDTPLTVPERLAVMLMVTGAARWAGIVLTGYARTEARDGVPAAEITAREDALYRQLITADGYPHLRAAIDADVFLDASDPFSFGLARALDGVSSYLDAAARGRRDGPHAAVEVADADAVGDRRYREAVKAVRQAEKELRNARRVQRQTLREARERLGKRAGDA
jgi:AcrR family transcriptional regulator